MKQYRTTAFAALCLLSASVTSACDWDVFPKVEFDPSIYLFQGRIVGFVRDSLAPSHLTWFAEDNVPERESHAAGLLVEPTILEHVPARSSVYSVFPVGRGASCEPVFRSIGDLEGMFSRGDTVAVMASANEVLHGVPSGSTALLTWEHHLLFNIAEVGGSQKMQAWGTDPFGGENFEWIKRQTESALYHANNASEESRFVMGKLFISWSARLRFEFERDLVSLSSGPPDNRIPLLRKIRRYWFSKWFVEDLDTWHVFGEEIDCSFTALVGNYTSSQAERDELGGWLLYTRLRPLATPEACEASARRTVERREQFRLKLVKRNAINSSTQTPEP